MPELAHSAVLGRTGLPVSRLGLGCGGPSRLGRTGGGTVKAAVAIVEHALELGINVVDTAPVYGTEPIVAVALRGKRDKVVLSSKSLLPKDLSRLPPDSVANAVYRYGSTVLGRLIGADELRRNVENSLQRLGTDYLDVFYLHAVTVDQYRYVVTELLPTLGRLREEGKIRYLGLTEALADTDHRMLVTAIEHNYWDVVMMGFNFAATSARDRPLPVARQRDIGVVIMGAARPVAARKSGSTVPAQYDGFQDTTPGFAAAYRYCADEPGVHVVLTGTGSRDHLTANVREFNAQSETHARSVPNGSIGDQ